MRRLRFFWGAFIVLFMVLLVPVASADYRLGAGDVIRITVWGHEDLSVITPVRPDGRVSVPLGGDIKAVDLTVQQLKEEVTEVLKDYIKEPTVTVLIEKFRTIRVQVLGAVRVPGYYELPPASKIVDAVSRAGGALDDGDLTQVALTRDGSGTTAIDVTSVLQGHSQVNSTLDDSDIVYVPRTKKAVVVGQVKVPGSYIVYPGMTVMDLFALAGGAVPEADLRKAVLTRRGTGEGEQIVDLENLMNNRVQTNQYPVQPGDTLFLPKRQEVVVLGEVRRPGVYSVDGKLRLLDVIAHAGGVTEQAKSSAVTITSVEREPNRLVVDLNALVEQEAEGNVQLAGGDVVYIPKGRKQVSILGEVAQPGSYPVEDGDRLVDVVARAGGVTKTAALSKVTVTYTDKTGEPKTAQVDLKPLLEKTDLNWNLPVSDGDLIFVPEADRKVLVMGEVANPGAYMVRDGYRILDVIAMAGGPTPLADTKHGALIKAEEGTIEFNLDRLYANDPEAINYGVSGGDAIIFARTDKEVLVLGAVQRPGSYMTERASTVLDLLAKSGGPTEAADLARVQWVRKDGDGQEKSLDLSALRGSGIVRDNPSVNGGDVIVVPEAKSQVLVLGEVNRPGYYLPKPGATILDVIAMAGDVKSTADLDGVSLTRNDGESRNIPVPLRELRSNQMPEKNFEVKGQDVIVVPKGKTEALILGAVRSPGSFAVDEGDSVLDALAKAGGTLDSADLTRVALTQRVGDGQATRYVDLSSSLSRGEVSEIYTIRGGDIVVVPEGNKQVLVLGDVNRPGSYPWKEGLTVLDLLALANGPRPTANLGTVTLTNNQSRESLELNLDDVLENRDKARYTVNPGDALYIPQAKQVLVLGKVNRPGSYYVPSGSKVLDALALAGGPSDDANLNGITLSRPSETGSTVRVMDYGELTTTASGENVPIRGGDILFVAEAKREVLVLGEVKRPGLYAINDGAVLMEAIGAAGGPTERAALQSVGLYRNGDLAQKDSFTMGREKLLFVGDAKENPTVRGGDIIFVPETKRPDWTKVFSFLSGIKLFKELMEW